MLINLKIVKFVFLYSLQGIPYGFQSRFVQLILRTKGVQLTTLGFMKLLFIPWILKSVYAPFVDNWFTHRFWLTSSVLGLLLLSVVQSVYADYIFDDLSKVYLLGIILFAYNFFAATQDIAVDALALSSFEKHDLVLANIAQVTGYKLGAIFGGGVLAFMSAFIPLRWIFMILSSYYVLGVIVSFTLSQEKVKTSEELIEIESTSYVNTLKSAFKTPSTMKIVSFLLIYKAGEIATMNMLSLFFVDRGYSLARISFWTGMLGQLCSLIGSFIAKEYLKKCASLTLGLKSLLLWRIYLEIVLVTLVWLISASKDYLLSEVAFYSLCFIMNTSLCFSGCITTCTFTVMMQCTRSSGNISTHATHFTLLSTAEVLGKLIIASTAPMLVALVGYDVSFGVFLLLTCLPFVFLKVTNVCDSSRNDNYIEKREHGSNKMQ